MKHLITITLILIVTFRLFTQDWIPLNGPIGTRVWHSIIRHQTGEIFSFTASGEVFLSPDKGKTWTKISKGIVPLSESSTPIYLSKLAESKDGKVFLYNDKHFYLYNPVDSSWIIKSSGLYVSHFTISPNNTIYAEINNDLYISLDDGINFIQKSNSQFAPAQFECKGNGHNFALRTANILYSFDDDGSNLQKLDSIEPSLRIIYDESTGNLINFTLKGIFLSKDIGKSFDKINIPGFPSYTTEYGTQMPNGNLLALGETNFISQDGGNSWDEFHFYKLNKNVNYGFAYLSDDLTLIYGNNRDTYLQNAGKEGIKLIIPSNRPSVISVINYGENNLLCSIDGSPSFQFSNDNGNSWDRRDSTILDAPISSEYMNSEGNYFDFAYDSLTIFNAGKDKLIRKPYPNPNILSIQGGLITKSDKVIVFDEYKFYISNDKGSNWQNYPLLIDYNYFKCSSNDILYAPGSDNFYYSLDFGQTVNQFGIKGTSRYGYQFLSKNNVFYWVEENPDTTYNLHSSNDFGNNSILEDNTDLQWTKLIYIDDNDNRYFDARNKIIIRHHGSIQEDSISFDGLNITKFQPRTFYFGQNGYIYCAVPNRVLYRTTHKIPLTKAENIQAHLLELSAIPNPFNQTTKIYLPEVFEGSKYQVIISDLYGRVVKKYVGEEKELLIDSGQLASGCYLVKVNNLKGQLAQGKVFVFK